MFSLISLSCLIGIAMSQGYGVPAPAPVQPGYGPVVVPPRYVPGYRYGYPPHRPYHSRYDRRSSSSEGDSECRDCNKIKTSCNYFNGDKDQCFKAKITYIKYNGCKRAVISCGNEEGVQLMTKNEDIISTGQNIDKMVKCDGNRWKVKDQTGEKIKFKKVYCVKPEETRK